MLDYVSGVFSKKRRCFYDGDPRLVQEKTEDFDRITGFQTPVHPIILSNFSGFAGLA